MSTAGASPQRHSAATVAACAGEAVAAGAAAAGRGPHGAGDARALASMRPAPMRPVVMATFAARARGLLGRSSTWLAADEVLVFPLCASVHTFGMRACIDVAFLDAHGRVLLSRECVPSGKLLRCRGACCVLERLSDAGQQPQAPQQPQSSRPPSASRPPWPRVGDDVVLAACRRLP